MTVTNTFVSQKLITPIVVIVVLLAGILAGTATAGVLVAPTVVFISDNNRTGRLEVQNTSNEPREISVRLAFGLPESDSLGNVYVQLQDSNITHPRSAVDWVKAFPRKIVVPPNGTQVIRLVARPPQDLRDGEYWARIVVTSREGAGSLPSPGDDDQIATRLNMVMQTAIMLKYRNGECVTHMELTDRSARLTERGAEVMLGMRNTGNASYMGVLRCVLVDADGRTAAEKEFNIAVYDDLLRRVDMDFDRTQFRGPFTLDVKVTSEGRTDVAREDMLAGNDVTYTMTVE